MDNEIENDQETQRSSRSRSRTPYLRSSSERDTEQYLESIKKEKRQTVGTGRPKSKLQINSGHKGVLTSISETHTKEVVTVEAHHYSDESSKKSNIIDDAVLNRISEMDLKSGRRSERQKVKRRLQVNGASSLSKKDDVSRVAAQTRTSKLLSTSDYSSEEGEEPQISTKTFEVYRQAGDWWDKFPKTDYTYSSKSPHRQEIQPGVIPMPNMSRKSLRTVRSPDEEHAPAAINRRVITTSSFREHRSHATDARIGGTHIPRNFREWVVDSDVDEVDEQYTTQSHKRKDVAVVSHFVSWFIALWTLVTSTVTSTYSKVVSYWVSDTDEQYRTPGPPVAQLGRVTLFWNWLGLMLYKAAMYTSQLDFWLLLRAPRRDGDQRLGRLFLLLLPILLLAVWWFFSEWMVVPLTELATTSSILGQSVIALFSSQQVQEENYIHSDVDESPLQMAVQQFGGEEILMQLLAELKMVKGQVAELEARMALTETREKGQMPVREELAALHMPVTDLSEKLAILQEEVLLQNKADLQVQSQLVALNKKVEVLYDESQASQVVSEVTLLREQVDSLSADRSAAQGLDIMAKLESLQEKVETLSKNADKSENNHFAQFSILKEQVDTLAHARTESEALEIVAELAELRVKVESLTQDRAEGTSVVAGLASVQGQVEGLIGRQLALSARLARCCRLPLEARFAHLLARSQSGLNAAVQSLQLAHKDIEARLSNLTVALRSELHETAQHSTDTILLTVTDRIEAELARQVRAADDIEIDNFGTSGGLSAARVRQIVNEALAVYDADKTGMVDYALESSGGSIISTRCTESYQAKTATLSLFGIPVWHPANNPRGVIQPGVHPGECWAFSGSQGYLVIRLSGLVRVSAFSLEHIPRALSPTGRIDSAPKDFSVWGLESEKDKDPTKLGKYTYKNNGTSLQFFPVQRTDVGPFEIVELRVESNHGNMQYTCLYRFRVHGVLVPT